ncbi:Segregation and condensation protein B [Neisseria gonorrhoeae]|uniref:Segregation and condensation protein B n=1 Tax=Neisseria gonorrhoeae TaxID=485 RepID=A0A378VZT9_NEIGO|nr:Segregation and condensation protein B [Neisseria gonorrhoeae]
MRELCVPPLSQDKLIDVLAQLKTRWQDRALQLVHTQEGWRFQIVQTAFERLGSLQEQRAPRYSRAVMETLAIIAYQQPVTRGDIEGIRGVAVSQNVMQTLQDRGGLKSSDIGTHWENPHCGQQRQLFSAICAWTVWKNFLR